MPRRIIFAGLFCLFLLGYETVLFSQTDFFLLRDIICSWEHRGHPNPDDAIGSAGEVGRCQMKPATARQIGYRGTNKNLLSLAFVNRAWALEKLYHCERKKKTDLPFILSRCYNGGANATTKSSLLYARQILSDYATQSFKKQFARSG